LLISEAALLLISEAASLLISEAALLPTIGSRIIVDLGSRIIADLGSRIIANNRKPHYCQQSLHTLRKPLGEYPKGYERMRLKVPQSPISRGN
jgi:hypothetical protein